MRPPSSWAPFRNRRGGRFGNPLGTASNPGRCVLAELPSTRRPGPKAPGGGVDTGTCAAAAGAHPRPAAAGHKAEQQRGRPPSPPRRGGGDGNRPGRALPPTGPKARPPRTPAAPPVTAKRRFVTTGFPVADSNARSGEPARGIGRRNGGCKPPHQEAEPQAVTQAGLHLRGYSLVRSV